MTIEGDAAAKTSGAEREPGAGIASGFLTRLFGPVSEQPVYVSSLPNIKGDKSEPGERHVSTREIAVIEKFFNRWDRPKRALYFCVATVRPNEGRRAKDTVSEIILLHADVDFKNIDLTPGEIMRKLDELRLLPTFVVISGHGAHLYWTLREAIIAAPETIEQVEGILRQLCDHVGGDRACCEVSRLMRLPGSHNSKDGGWLDVTIASERPNMRYELGDITEWLGEVAPLIRRKDEAPIEDNPWLTVAKQFGIKPPIDVEQRLTAMRYGEGNDQDRVHPTQLSVTAALLNRGHPIDEVVATVLAATRVAAGHHAENWNWKREEREVRKMCTDWIAKHPEISRREQVEEDTARATGTDDVIVLAKERANRQQKSKAGSKGSAGGRSTTPVAIAEGVIEIVRNAGGDLLLTAGDLYRYHEGIWRPANPGDDQWLRCLIQQGAEALGEGAKLGVVNAAWKRLTEHPDLHRANVTWDRRGLIALANGVLDLRTRKFGDWDPSYYLRRKVDVAYDLTAGCTKFLEFLAFVFSDADTIALLQEFFGACLAVGLLNRENRRALLLNGPSRTGKTEVARVIRRLVGEPVASPSVNEIGGRFGAATFYGASAWIRDDAINEGDRIDPERFKTIVTGEPIDIERKNRQPLRQISLEIPVILTTNSLPTSRDSSDAIFNRSLVVEMTKVISEETAVDEARRHYGVPLGVKLGDWIFDRESPGILNWALEGLARLLARGHFNIPEQVRAAIQNFKDNSNPVAEWARTMLERADANKVERGDLLCAFHGWWREEMGDDVRLLGGRWLMPKLHAACPWIGLTYSMGTRYSTGVRLNAQGLKFWQRQSTDAAQRGHGSRGTASSVDYVNKLWTKDDDDP